MHNTIYLNWTFKYNSLGINCVEYAYFRKVKKQEINLNEESLKYKWCNLDDFIDLIEWLDNNKILKKVLVSALNNKLYYNNEKIVEINAFK